MNCELDMNPNKVVAFLGKSNKEFTKADIVRYIKENGIRMVNFMYPAGDGRLKTLNFVINNAAYLDAILTCGERVEPTSPRSTRHLQRSKRSLQKHKILQAFYLPQMRIFVTQNRMSSALFGYRDCLTLRQSLF